MGIPPWLARGSRDRAFVARVSVPAFHGSVVADHNVPAGRSDSITWSSRCRDLQRGCEQWVATAHRRADGNAGFPLAEPVWSACRRTAVDHSTRVDTALSDGLRTLIIDPAERACTRNVKIPNLLGLHARPAAEIVKLASQFTSETVLRKDGFEVNGKSIMGVMMLAAECGSTLTISCTGMDSHEAVEALADLVGSGFGEELAAEEGVL
ncbi:MAG: HPr family phosphocarrier protein [Gemmatimonadales bacterium]|nr:MAG: HPr family phosphocarrier protein [Gemmatimonadales bacterium]